MIYSKKILSNLKGRLLNVDNMFKARLHLSFPMSSIDNRIAIEGMVASIGARSQSESHPEKLPINDQTAIGNKYNEA
jgi:hypothetical protein